MPKRQGQRIARYANILTAVFRCPHCQQRVPYHEDEIDPEGICCRNCRRFFRAATFEKDHLRCAACQRRLKKIEQREADRLYRFCPDCAFVFDELVAEFDILYQQLLRGIRAEIQRRIRLRRGPTADPEPAAVSR